ncbi:DsbA family protein [Porphyromonadaceae bacterium W3.11]|nr:DsbA family protein [Porphyromonadaceae bacterium W3.11]
MSARKIVIDFWGDITCPFCYLGEHALRRALSSFEYQDLVEFRWRSCLLHADWKVGESRTWNEFKDTISDFDVKRTLEKKESILKELANRYSLHYNLANAFSHNSVNAARLLKLANSKSKALDLALAFGEGYFEEAIDMSQLRYLREKAVEVGLSKSEVDEVLSSDLFLDEVNKDQEDALKYAYNYVPTIYFNGSFINEGLLKEQIITEALHQTMKEIQ